MDTADKAAADLRLALSAKERCDAALDEACRRIVRMLTIDFDAALFDPEEFARACEHLESARRMAIESARTVKRLERLVLS